MDKSTTHPAIVSAEDHELIERMARRMTSGGVFTAVRAELTIVYCSGYAAGVGYAFTPDPVEPEADIVADAIEALRAFGDVDRHRADHLLSMWSRRRELTVEQRAEVVHAFPAVIAADPTPA